MYIRFITPGTASWARGSAAGFFGPAYEFRNSRYTPAWLRDALREEIKWFCDHLDRPTRFGIETRKSRRTYAGVCWFRDDARACIDHANTLVELLAECDVPVSRITARTLNDIVYRDRQQVVAMPRRHAEITWH